MQLQDFSKGMELLNKFFRPLTDEQIDIYWERLKTFPAKPWLKAVDSFIEVSTPGGYFPMIGDIKDSIRFYIEQEEEQRRSQEERRMRMPQKGDQKKARVNYQKIVSLLEHKERKASER